MEKLKNRIADAVDSEAAAEPSSGRIITAAVSLRGESRMRARAVPVWSEWKVMAAVPTRRSPLFRQPRRLDRRLGCGGRPRVRVAGRSSAASGDSGGGGGDPPGLEADGEYDSPPEQCLPDVENYLTRLGRHGTERWWLVEQVSYLGHDPHRVSAAISLAVANGLAQSGAGDDGGDVIWSGVGR